MNILEERPLEGFVYLVWAIDTPRYKVGRSKNPHRRVEALNLQSCYPLKLLETCYFDNAEKHEKRLHCLLAQWRVHGEWFELPKYLLSTTSAWFPNSKCNYLKGFDGGQVVVGFHKKSRSFTVADLRAHSLLGQTSERFGLPEEIKMPSDNLEYSRVCNWLKRMAQGEVLSSASATKLEAIIGVLPCSSSQAALWRPAIKKMRNHLAQQAIWEDDHA